MNGPNQPQQGDNTTELPGAEEWAEWLRDRPLDDALDFLLEVAQLVGWQGSLNEAGLRLLKPGVPAAEAAAA
jgi:hypothetical protein